VLDPIRPVPMNATLSLSLRLQIAGEERGGERRRRHIRKSRRAEDSIAMLQF
jgi:hypothetical protein